MSQTRTRLHGLPKNLAALLMAFTICLNAVSQNVGIGTDNPLYPLHVVGTIRTDADLRVAGMGWVVDKFTIGSVLPNDEYKLRVIGGKTWTSTLTAGGSGFDGKMLSVYGSAQIANDLAANTLNLSGDGIVGGNFRIDGRIGINGPTNAAYGLIVNNANTYLQGDAIVEGNTRMNGRIGVNGPTNGNYGLIVNNANTYLQGDAIVEGNTRLNGRIGINGATNGNYGLIVNNANTYLQGDLTVSGNVNFLGTATINGKGNVHSDGPSSLSVGFSSYYTNQVYDGKEEKALTVNVADFYTGTQNVRVMIAQFEPGSGYEADVRHFTWYVYDCNPATNTCKIRIINQSSLIKVLKGTFYLMAVAKD